LGLPEELLEKGCDPSSLPALNGIESSIKFGVRKDSEGKVAGHAWLEHQGESLLEIIEPEYAVTFAFPADEVSRKNLSLLPKILQH
jgi:hypothetical protein